MGWLVKNIALAVGMWVLRRVARALMNRHAARNAPASGRRGRRPA